jgi:hypothetical protein
MISIWFTAFKKARQHRLAGRSWPGENWIRSTNVIADANRARVLPEAGWNSGVRPIAKGGRVIRFQES